MIRILMTVLIGPLLAALLLTGCSTVPTEGSFTDTAADKIIPADTFNERAVRACLATAVVTEVWTYRLLWFGGTVADREEAIAAFDRMLAAVGALKPETVEAQAPWFRTEMFYVVVSFVHGAEGQVTARVIGSAQAALVGDVAGLLGDVRQTAGQIALAVGMIEDIRDYFAAHDLNDPAQFDAAWQLCTDRVARNIKLLSPPT